MFKHRIQLTILMITLISSASATPLQSATYCLGNCYKCPQTPYQCPFIQSLTYPKSNHNCLPYSVGNNCDDVGFGFQYVKQSGLTGWTSTTANLTNQTCTIFHQPATVAKFPVIGLMLGGVNISKTVPINQDTLQSIILKMSFTFQSSSIFTNQSSTAPTTPPAPPQTPPATQQQPQINPDGTVDPQTGSGEVGVNNTNKITNRTNRAFVDVKVTGPGISYILQLNYPITSDVGSIINTTCGVHFQYVSTYNFNTSIPTGNQNLNVQIISIGGPEAKWGLAEFQIFLGCGGLMVPSGNVRCGACMSGFYPLMSRQNRLMGCAPCPFQCKTCTQDRCTLCQPHSTLNPSTNQCQLTSTYIQTKPPKILLGSPLNSTSRTSTNININYFYNMIQSDGTNTVIILQSELASITSYAIKFFIIYDQQFIINLKNREVQVLNYQDVIQVLDVDGFRKEIGFYDQRFGKPGVKYYVRVVNIDRLNMENNQKMLQISIKAPQGAGKFYISNYELIQYQCTARCSQCNRQSNTCIQCNGFFITRGQQSCITCANGFYLSRFYNNTATDEIPANTSILRTKDDMCIKCHSSCKQCIGPQLDQCIDCFNLFYLDSVIYNRQCIKCLYDRRAGVTTTPNCQRCFDMYNPEFVFTAPSCPLCVGDRAYEDTMIGEACQACWVGNGLAYGRCIPTPASSLTFYGADITNGIVDLKSWKSSSPQGFNTITCTSDYKQLWGIPTQTTQANQTIRYQQTNLPAHSGLYIILNIFKIDIQTQVPGRRPPSIYIRIIDGVINQTIDLINRRNGSTLSPGSNLCQGDNNQMIQTYSYDAPKHNSSKFGLQIVSEGGGIYLRQLEMYLGNCASCAGAQLNYQVKYLPRYSYNNTVSSGLDVWIDFNKPVNISTSTNLQSAFKFSIDQLPQLKLDNIEFQNQLALNNRLKYYIPLDTSFQNGTLRIRTSPDARIFGINSSPLQTSRRVLINSPLSILQSDYLINRFSKLSQDDLVSTNQIYWFFNFFQWFALIGMIVCAFFGIGVVFEEFSILLQLLFLHVYISSALLPATYKAPLSGLQRMENLNYFADPHAQSIEKQWFGDYQHPSPYVFQQYNRDILFERSFYPRIIINLIYFGWFIIMLVLYKVLPFFRSSSSPIVAFFRNIPARPLNFIDQIWRYQFITTMWSAFMQFHILKNDTAWQRLNLALCFISFIISIIWPFFVVCYTYRLNSIKYSTDFMYKYQDIYYKKMQTISEGKIKYYYYVFIRFIRYFIMALFICVFTEHQIIAPVILICANIIQIIYVVAMRIYYNSIIGTIFKVAENLGFIGVQVALLFVYGLSDTARDKDFLNLGHALNVLYVIMIFLGLLRVAYLIYQKIKNFKFNLKYGVDNGQVRDIGPTPLPNTDRGDIPNNNLFK